MARWLERLQEFDFEILHRKGKIHSNADALSRLPCNQCGRDNHNQPVSATSIAATMLQPQSQERSTILRDAQLADPTLGPLLRGKEKGRKPEMKGSRYTRRLLQIWDQLHVLNGILCRMYASANDPKETPTVQQVIPQSLREEILRDLP